MQEKADPRSHLTLIRMARMEKADEQKLPSLQPHSS